MRGSRETPGASSRNDLLDSAAARMLERTHEPPARSPHLQSDGFIFSGNRHDAFPRALLLDRRLTPLERNAWQVFRMLLNDDGITAFPTYDQLAPYLASMPCAARASHETVARALTLLRLTRWISLVRRQRDPRTGRIAGNLYVLHDEPLTPWEAIQLDPEYLGLVSHALDHSSRSIQRIGVHTLREIAEDPMLAGKLLPSRLQILTQRLSERGWEEARDNLQAVDSHDSEGSADIPLRNRDDLASDPEDGPKTPEMQALRNPKTGRTVRIQKEVSESLTTVPGARGGLCLPNRFGALKPEQQSGALAALHTIDAILRQAVLDEWDARCAASAIRNPAGYLFGLIQKALRGEFNTWAAAKAPGSARQPESPGSGDRKIAETHVARLQTIMRFT
ncbi:MAG: STY4528 family pathogenicity island replication protein [Shinella sp.]|nr:STY4528 family pathogenicity island replication protein [Shinella sp.]